jgi:AMP nucleosidase
LEDFTKFILLTNFQKYVEILQHFNVPILGLDALCPMHVDGVTIINFGMGSANAATIMDLLSAILPTAVLFWENAAA